MSPKTTRFPLRTNSILAQVFGYLELRDRISCSQVKRTWRTAAILTPQLWTALIDPPLSHTAISAFIGRAKGREVTLDVCPRTLSDFTRLCKVLSLVLPHLAGLDIYFYARAAKKFKLRKLWTALLGPAPKLRRLCLHNDFLLSVKNKLGYRVPATVPVGLFACLPGRLETVVLGGFRMDRIVPAFADVCDLDIEAHVISRQHTLATQFPAARALTVHNIYTGEDNAPGRLPPHLDYLSLYFSMGQSTTAVRTWLAGCDVRRIRELQFFNAEELALNAVPPSFKPTGLICLKRGCLAMLRIVGENHARTAYVGRGALQGILLRLRLERLVSVKVAVEFLPRLDLRSSRRLKSLEVVFPSRPDDDIFGRAAIMTMPRLETVARLVLLDSAKKGTAVCLLEDSVLTFLDRVTPNLKKLEIPAGVSVRDETV